jgi:hypothetical protein
MSEPTTPEEKWKRIPEYPNYFVSDRGRVVNAKYRRVLKQSGDDAKKVGLYAGGVGKTLYVHRLVARLFLDRYFDDMEVVHIDGDKTNNTASNLKLGGIKGAALY